MEISFESRSTYYEAANSVNAVGYLPQRRKGAKGEDCDFERRKNHDLIVRRGSGEASRLESGAGNCRYTPLAKIQF